MAPSQAGKQVVQRQPTVTTRLFLMPSPRLSLVNSPARRLTSFFWLSCRFQAAALSSYAAFRT